MFGDMIPRFHESSKWRLLLYSSGTFRGEFFSDLTYAVLENRSYGRIVHFRSMDLWHVKTRTEFCGVRRAHKRGFGGVLKGVAVATPDPPSFCCAMVVGKC